MDGKVLHRCFDKSSGKSPLHMVSAWGCDQRLMLAEIGTAAKSKEIPFEGDPCQTRSPPFHNC